MEIYFSYGKFSIGLSFFWWLAFFLLIYLCWRSVVEVLWKN